MRLCKLVRKKASIMAIWHQYRDHGLSAPIPCIKYPKGWKADLPREALATGTRQRGCFRKKSETDGFVDQLSVQLWAERNNIREMNFVQRQVAEPDVCETSELTKLLASGRQDWARLAFLCLGATCRNFAVSKCAEK